VFKSERCCAFCSSSDIFGLGALSLGELLRGLRRRDPDLERLLELLELLDSLDLEPLLLDRDLDRLILERE